MSATPSPRTPPSAAERWLDSHGTELTRTAWRGLKTVVPGIELASLRGRLAEAASTSGSEVVTIGGSAFDGVTTVSPKAMETDLIGIKTFEVSELLVPDNDPQRQSHLNDLAAAAAAASRDAGAQLVILRVDADDPEALWSAQLAGFSVHETNVAWLADSCRAADVPAPALRPGVEAEIVVHEGNPEGLLDEETIAALAERTATWGLSHLASDPRVSRDGVERFYRAWVHNIAAGTWCDSLAVAHRGNEVLGIFSEVTDRALERTTGIAIRTAGWLVVTDPGSGLGAPLLAAIGRRPYPGGTHHLWETQVRNLATIRSFERTGLVTPMRASHTLHAWHD